MTRVPKKFGDYIKSLSPDERRVLVSFIRSVDKRPRGRPRGWRRDRNVPLKRSDQAKAELWAALHAATKRYYWCRDHDRQRAPMKVIARFVEEGRAEARKKFGKDVTAEAVQRQMKRVQRVRPKLAPRK